MWNRKHQLVVQVSKVAPVNDAAVSAAVQPGSRLNTWLCDSQHNVKWLMPFVLMVSMTRKRYPRRGSDVGRVLHVSLVLKDACCCYCCWCCLEPLLVVVIRNIWCEKLYCDRRRKKKIRKARKKLKKGDIRCKKKSIFHHLSNGMKWRLGWNEGLLLFYCLSQLQPAQADLVVRVAAPAVSVCNLKRKKSICKNNKTKNQNERGGQALTNESFHWKTNISDTNLVDWEEYINGERVCLELLFTEVSHSPICHLWDSKAHISGA